MTAIRKIRSFAGEIAATDCFEIEVSLTGTFSPGYAGTRIDPPEDDRIEDVDVADISLVIPTTQAERNYPGNPRWKTISILDGVDRKSAAYLQIVENLLRLRGEEFVEALQSEAY